MSEERSRLRDVIYEIIFEADTPMGKLFDVALLWTILAAVLLVMLQSVQSYAAQFHEEFWHAELVISLFFTVEYILRIYSAKDRKKYMFSFFGIVDIVSLIPFYLGLYFDGAATLATIRVTRLLRVFLVLKLRMFVGEGRRLWQALWRSRHKIAVFFGFVVTLAIVVGSLMYLIEGGQNESFSNIPVSLYWAIVTMTTVGYGDLSPQTPLGQFFASTLMIMGYAIIAVPTGIVSAELVQNGEEGAQACAECGLQTHQEDARYCRGCGKAL